MRYFYPDRTLIEAKNKNELKLTFIDFNSRLYYYLNRDFELEKRIENILHNTIDGKLIDKEALKNIVRWKADKRYFTFSKGESFLYNKKV